MADGNTARASGNGTPKLDKGETAWWDDGWGGGGGSPDGPDETVLRGERLVREGARKGGTGS